MGELDETPRGNRIHIAFFGLRNVGKSTLVNAFTGQPIAIVSDVAGTTTDPVSKAMEILPLGPCLITDTAGLDDVGELGRLRVAKTLAVLETTDVAVWVKGADESAAANEWRAAFLKACAARRVTVLDYDWSEGADGLKRRIAALKLGEVQPGVLDGLVKRGDHVVCVCPIDESAPKGRLILPQVQVIRACLDRGAVCTVCQPDELKSLDFAPGRFALVITDSQAFGTVAAAIPPEQSLTSFSILFARQKGDLEAYANGLARLKELVDGDTVLIAEGCTHHRQCNDIGTVKIPKALAKITGRKLTFRFSSGAAFELDASVKLVVQCGGCMLTRREVLRRIGLAKDAGVPIVNYGMVLAQAAGVDLARCLK